MLNESEKARVTEDFASWSGGFTPDESDSDEIALYVEFARPSDLDEGDVRDFLMECISVPFEV
jgi:hypothetical protein